MEIREKLLELADPKYKAFHAKLIPTVPPERILGVRKPALNALAREIEKTPEADAFLLALPHETYDENALHGALICRMRDFNTALAAAEAFLPYIDNWAVCDMLSPKAFAKNLPALHGKIFCWLQSDRTYTVRFGLVTAMTFFLDGAFAPDLLARAAAVHTEEYYVRMAQAWLLATAWAKDRAVCLAYLDGHHLDDWTFRKFVQKARESYRVSPEDKAYLRSLIEQKKEK